jgi:hypothetical protein
VTASRRQARDHLDQMEAIVRRDPERLRLLRLVRDLELPDCWIAAGFLRNAIWDALHGRAPRQAYDDIDVIWFDANRASASHDSALEAHLLRRDASVHWSIKNQARMHVRNGDAAYCCAADAMCHWVETTAAVALRIDGADRIEFLVPLGTHDLFDMIIRPGPRFRDDKRPIFAARVAEKRWFENWPLLRPAD